MENRLQRVCVPLFKGDEKSFPFWKRRMEQYLKQDGLLYTLEKTPDEEDYAAPTEGADAAAENARKEKLQKRLKDDDAAVNQFWFALDDIAMGHVLDCRYAKHIMDTLIRFYPITPNAISPNAITPNSIIPNVPLPRIPSPRMLFPRIYKYLDMMILMTFPHHIGIRGNVIRGDGSFGVLKFGVMAFGLMAFGVMGFGVMG